MGKRGRYSHEKKVEVLERIRREHSESNSPVDKSSADDDDDSAIGSDQGEICSKTKGPSSPKKAEIDNLTGITDVVASHGSDPKANVEPEISARSVLSREEVNVIIDELLEVNRRLYSDWIPNKNCNKDELYAQYMVSINVS